MNMRDVILVRALSRGLPTNSQTMAAVEAWLDDHPEATTTVEDGAITRAKLANQIGNAVDPLTDMARVTSLSNNVAIARGNVIDVVGIPVYVDDVTEYSSYSLEDTGWYLFARVEAKNGVTVGSGTSVEGAEGYIATTGTDHIDIAVKFDVAALIKVIEIEWDNSNTDTIVFRANDLAIRNLDYRSTFYIYDISDFATWSFARTTDTSFASGKKYYTLSNGAYTLAEVTDNAAVPAYYEKTTSYSLTADATFQDGKTYYTENDSEYTAATVTTGDTVTENTYYEMTETYALTEDTAFADGTDYYTLSNGTYSLATVTDGDPIVVYYNHSKLSFAGMTRNVTYRFDEMVDAPIEITLPEVPDDGYGAWFEIQMRFDNTYSITLLPTDNTVKIGTAQTQAQSAGINVVDLQYSDVDNVKMWTLLNTHSNIPTT